MICAISGESPQEPVASRKSGTVFERRLIESYIAENASDPVNGEPLTLEDLLPLQQPRTVKPRPPQLTSIPALLATFQNEWDALVLESYQLKQQLSETRQELSTALYYNDAAQAVIARVQKERDEARDALARVSVTGSGGSVNGGRGGAQSNGNGVDAMQVDGQPLPAETQAKFEETQTRLQGTRRKRPIPEDWATAETIAAFQVSATADTQFTGARTLAADASGDFFLCGDSDGDIGVYDVKQAAFTTRSNVGAGAVTGGCWAEDRAVVSTGSGAVVVTRGGSVEVKFSQHAGAAAAVAAHPCGEVVASVGEDRSFVVYDLGEKKVLTQVYTDAELTTIAFHPDGHILAAGTANGSIKLFDTKSCSLLHTFDTPDPSNQSPSQSLSFSENGTWLASASAGSSTVTVWDLRKMNVVKTLEIGSAVTGVEWDYTGQFLAVAAGTAGVVVAQYSKAGKAWSEPLRRAVGAVDAKWGPRGNSLVVLTGEGAVAVLSS